jgi:hypothetical protein
VLGAATHGVVAANQCALTLDHWTVADCGGRGLLISDDAHVKIDGCELLGSYVGGICCGEQTELVAHRCKIVHAYPVAVPALRPYSGCLSPITRNWNNGNYWLILINSCEHRQYTSRHTCFTSYITQHGSSSTTSCSRRGFVVRITHSKTVHVRGASWPCRSNFFSRSVQMHNQEQVTSSSFWRIVVSPKALRAHRGIF